MVGSDGGDVSGLQTLNPGTTAGTCVYTTETGGGGGGGKATNDSGNEFAPFPPSSSESGSSMAHLGSVLPLCTHCLKRYS